VGHPKVPPALLEKLKKQYPNMQKGVCPVGGASAVDSRKRQQPSLSSLEFAHLFTHFHAIAGKTSAASDCPAFKSGCAFKNSNAAQNVDPDIGKRPLSELISDCPAFSVSHGLLSSQSPSRL
jgi:hypothetical protein